MPANLVTVLFKVPYVEPLTPSVRVFEVEAFGKKIGLNEIRRVEPSGWD